jgi:hypothetical protein
LLSSRFGGTHSNRDTLTYQFALEFREGCKDVQQEARHRITVIGVDVLSDGDEPHSKRDQFLNAFHGGGYAPPPSIEFPNNHYVNSADTSILEQSVQFWP